MEEDRKGNVIVSLDGKPRMKILNPHIGLLYTYLAWYIMHCLSLMSAVHHLRILCHLSNDWNVQLGMAGTC